MYRATMLLALMTLATAASVRLQADTQTTGSCGGVSITIPFTDVAGNNIFFCSIAAAYFTGLANGTSATTYSPGDLVTREQMAAFITRTLDQSLVRGNRRAALNQWDTPVALPIGATTGVGNLPTGVASDGADIWVANAGTSSVARVRASDGKLLEVWTGATGANDVLVSRGRIFAAGGNPGHLYRIDPRQPVGAVSVIATVGSNPFALATDGEFIWTANGASVSKVNPDTGQCQTFTQGFGQPRGILYDGESIWVADFDDDLTRLNSNGSIAQTVVLGFGQGAINPVFDGTNIWVPNYVSNAVIVVRAATGQVIATLTGNGLNAPRSAAFDGQRILITNWSGDSVSLWKAADLTPLGSFSTGAGSTPDGACSDGINFWIVLHQGYGSVARF